MNPRDEERFKALIDRYDSHPMVQHMKDFIQHGDTTTYDHCRRVAKLSYLINNKLHLNADDNLLVPAALLHDFFLYDWHDLPTPTPKNFFSNHGFTHSKVAADNAKEVFDISDKMHDTIETHMWPLTITKVPRSREAAILCFADKCVALQETLSGK